MLHHGKPHALGGKFGLSAESVLLCGCFIDFYILSTSLLLYTYLYIEYSCSTVRTVRVRVRIKRHSGLGGQSGRKYVVVVKQSICRLSLGIQLSSHKFIALESH